MKFYLCKHCGNIVEMVRDSGVNPVCCGEKMGELKANSVDAAKEKHVPTITVDGDSVRVAVGSIAHPMLEEHFIMWICLETEHGCQYRRLAPGMAPEALFSLEEDKAVAAYAFCNLHGLWKTEL